MRSSGRKVLKLLLASAVLFAIFAVPAHAQGAVSGTFTLPFDAQWGQLKLPAGTYSFDIQDTLRFHQIIVLQGTKIVGLVSPSEISHEDEANLHPSLLCVRHNANFFVRALRLPQLGTLYYKGEKEKPLTVAQAPELIQDVPITVSGK